MRVPILQQTTAVECGPTTLAMVLGAFGHATTVRALREEFGTGRDGTSARRIAEVARTTGLTARGVRVTREGLATVRCPAIAHWRGNHFVVVERIRARRITVVDPGSGRGRLDWDEFFENFSGTVIEFAPGPSFSRRRGGDRFLTRFVRDLVRLAPGLVLAAVLLSGLAQALGLASAAAAKYGIDLVVGQGAPRGLGTLCLALAAFLGVQAVVNLTRGVALMFLQQRLDHRLTERFMTRLLRLPFRYFQIRSAGDLMSRVTSNTVVRDLVTSQLLSAVIDGTFVVVYTVVLISVSPTYALVTAVLAAIHVSVILLTLRPVRELTQRELSAQAEAQNVTIDAVRGIEFVKAAGLADAVIARWKTLFGRYLHTALRRRRLDTANDALVTLLRSATPMILLVVGLSQVLNHHMTLGTMVALNAVAANLITPVAQLAGSLRYLQTVSAHLHRIYDVLEEPPEPRRPSAVRPAAVAGALELKRVGLRYDRESPWVVHGVDLRVPAGTKVAVVGSTGSGKTSLARLVTGLVRPTEGQVLVDGRPLEDYDLEWLRRRFGVVTQESQVLCGSIRDNLCLGHGDLPDEVLHDALRRAQLLEDVAAMPLGLDTVVADGGSMISGGQRQRLAIARAILNEPALLVLDEATSHLDAATEERISAELSALRCTRLTIAHRMSTVVDADQIVVMDRGRVVEQGTHTDLIEFDGLYARLVSSQLLAAAGDG